MRHVGVLFGMTLAAGILAGAIVTQILHAQQPSMKRTPILTTDLEGLPGKGGTMFLAEYEPGARSGKHYHPGHEFIYVLEGSGIMEEVGKPPVAMKPGVAFYFLSSPEKPSYVHEARNLSTTEPMKLLVVLITDKGQPLAYPVKE